ncbi:SIR2 family protein [Lactobacillus mulieris]|nr:SIR2 family protein [Lactobacillus mulieris]MCZ3622322.1 SIR2 family protein [Lactobacillus mulieris]MCZ3636329.1 SIR2 family protein [Lactobacillus mulieris]MCZ3690697.1 SIR2 family protein [Lactobacillus mulieris]MCZ3696655.1 SIR2 family protein [Lactobacillus mulieris]MCZ3702778.1 SIR2 family protein [Lactobacillus mulieris]
MTKNNENYYKANQIVLSKSTSNTENSEECFLINDKILKDSEGKKISNFSKFKNLIRIELHKVLDRRYDNVILFAGAGASVVMKENSINDEYGKTIAMIAQDINDILEETNGVYSIDELSNLMKEDKSKVTNKKNKLDESFNLEDFISKLQSYKQFVDKNKKKKFENTIKKIYEVIIDKTKYSYNPEVMKHRQILDLLIKKVQSPNKLSVITTNYDTLFEEAAELDNYVVFDGFNFQYNSSFNSDMFNWNLVKEVPFMKTRELEYKKRVFNLLKIHGSLTWIKDGERILKSSKTEIINDKNKSPVMIFPSSNKYALSYTEPYFSLLTKFQELLNLKNTLLITTGFSFADNHIAEMVIQAIKNNPSLTTLITDYDIDKKEKNWKKLEGMRETNSIYLLKATLNGDLTEYIGDYDAD